MPDRRSWPWPSDSREDRARRIATSYRRLAELASAGRIFDLPNALRDLDQQWIDLGQAWVIPTQAPLNPDDWVTADEAEELFHMPSRSFYDWGRRGRIRVHQSDNGIRRYNVGDIITYSRQKGKR